MLLKGSGAGVVPEPNLDDWIAGLAVLTAGLSTVEPFFSAAASCGIEQKRREDPLAVE
jgi:hypothetical protein